VSIGLSKIFAQSLIDSYVMAVVFYACLINLDSSLADGVVSRTFVFCKLPSVL